MLALHAAVALFAAVMLARHLPAAVRAFRGPPEGREGPPRPVAGLTPAVNVLLALVLLAVAVKGLVGVLIRR